MTGLKIKRKVKENMFGQTEISIPENGKMDVEMEPEITFGKMVISTKGIGKTTEDMEKVII